MQSSSSSFMSSADCGEIVPDSGTASASAPASARVVELTLLASDAGTVLAKSGDASSSALRSALASWRSVARMKAAQTVVQSDATDLGGRAVRRRASGVQHAVAEAGHALLDLPSLVERLSVARAVRAVHPIGPGEVDAFPPALELLVRRDEVREGRRLAEVVEGLSDAPVLVELVVLLVHLRVLAHPEQRHNLVRRDALAGLAHAAVVEVAAPDHVMHLRREVPARLSDPRAQLVLRLSILLPPRLVVLRVQVAGHEGHRAPAVDAQERGDGSLATQRREGPRRHADHLDPARRLLGDEGLQARELRGQQGAVAAAEEPRLRVASGRRATVPLGRMIRVPGGVLGAVGERQRARLPGVAGVLISVAALEAPVHQVRLRPAVGEALPGQELRRGRRRLAVRLCPFRLGLGAVVRDAGPPYLVLLARLPASVGVMVLPGEVPPHGRATPVVFAQRQPHAAVHGQQRLEHGVEPLAAALLHAEDVEVVARRHEAPQLRRRLPRLREGLRGAQVPRSHPDAQRLRRVRRDGPRSTGRRQDGVVAALQARHPLGERHSRVAKLVRDGPREDASGLEEPAVGPLGLLQGRLRLRQALHEELLLRLGRDYQRPQLAHVVPLGRLLGRLVPRVVLPDGGARVACEEVPASLHGVELTGAEHGAPSPPRHLRLGDQRVLPVAAGDQLEVVPLRPARRLLVYVAAHRLLQRNAAYHGARVVLVPVVEEQVGKNAEESPLPALRVDVALLPQVLLLQAPVRGLHRQRVEVVHLQLERRARRAREVQGQRADRRPGGRAPGRRRRVPGRAGRGRRGQRRRGVRAGQDGVQIREASALGLLGHRSPHGRQLHAARVEAPLGLEEAHVAGLLAAGRHESLAEPRHACLPLAKNLLKTCS
eukprot:scaffold48_cov311-Pinguiococcus_pyrenoidosus.AAC.17